MRNALSHFQSHVSDCNKKGCASVFRLGLLTTVVLDFHGSVLFLTLCTISFQPDLMNVCFNGIFCLYLGCYLYAKMDLMYNWQV